MLVFYFKTDVHSKQETLKNAISWKRWGTLLTSSVWSETSCWRSEGLTQLQTRAAADKHITQESYSNKNKAVRSTGRDFDHVSACSCEDFYIRTDLLISQTNMSFRRAAALHGSVSPHRAFRNRDGGRDVDGSAAKTNQWHHYHQLV